MISDAVVGQAVTAQDLPWIPLRNGLAFKPLHFFEHDHGWVLLLRLDPGTEIPLHRHTGEVHGYTLSGMRRLGTGEIAGPGAYVYEPAGQVDSWTAVGDEPLIVFIVVEGAVEYLDGNHNVTVRATARSQHEAYLRYCADHGIEPIDLLGLKPGCTGVGK